MPCFLTPTLFSAKQDVVAPHLSKMEMIAWKHRVIVMGSGGKVICDGEKRRKMGWFSFY